MLLSSVLTKLAAAGLATKAAAGGAAVVVAASAAGAADALPRPAQAAFDDIVTIEAPAEDPDDTGTAVTDDADAPAVDGAEVAADATGAADGEPGVDGCEVARAASGKPLENCGDDDGDDDTDEDADDGAFGNEVAADATGAADGEPGVDGCEVARAASGKPLENCGKDDTDEDADEDAEADEDADDDGDFGADVAADATGASDDEPGVTGTEIAEKARAQGDDEADDTDRPGPPSGVPAAEAADGRGPNGRG